MNKTNVAVLQCQTLCAEVDLNHGAACTRLWDAEKGINVLYASNNPYVNGIPILFPANRISNGGFALGGYQYSLPITDKASECALHGNMSVLPFEAVSKTENEICCRRECRGDYFGFPQHFCIDLIYKLTPNALIQTLRVTNFSKPPLPLLFGFHTTFALPFCRQSSVEDVRIYADVDLEVERGENYLPTAIHPATDDFSKALQAGTAKIPTTVSRHYRAGKRGDMTLLDSRTGLLVRYEPDDAFRYRMIFTGDRERYICLEPQVAVINAPNASLEKEYTHVPLLSQGETAEYSSKLSLEVVTD